MIAAKRKGGSAKEIAKINGGKKETFIGEIMKNKLTYAMAIPAILFFLIFHYVPMFGVLIAFQDYRVAKGFFASEWVGLKHIIDFCQSVYFTRTVGNTVVISLMNILIGFPAPIILALLLNEIKSNGYKRVVQTVTYIPHFISTVIICGMVSKFCMKDGMFNVILGWFGFEAKNLLQEPAAFKWILVLTDLWQGTGWGSIVYLAALSNVDPTLYEAASIDGAGKFRQVFAVTLPAIIPTIITLFIMRMGSLLSVGSDKILLLYNPTIYETSDVINTYVYRKGLLEMNYSYSTAIGLFNSLINLCFLNASNAISRKVTETSLW